MTGAGNRGMTPADHAAPASAWWHWWLPGLLALVATLTGLGSLQRLDLLTLDLLSSAAPAAEQASTSSTAIIAIDERSLQQLGRWPWSRRTYAQLLDRLQAAPPESIAFGILFDLPDSQDAGADAAFAAAIGRSGRVVLPVTPVADGDGGGLRAALPAAELASAAAALGHVDVEIDRDGLLRRTYLTAEVGSSRSSHHLDAGRHCRRPWRNSGNPRPGRCRACATAPDWPTPPTTPGGATMSCCYASIQDGGSSNIPLSMS